MTLLAALLCTLFVFIALQCLPIVDVREAFHYLEVNQGLFFTSETITHLVISVLFVGRLFLWSIFLDCLNVDISKSLEM